MSKNIHTYTEKLNALWDQMRHTVEYLIKCKGIEWVETNSCGAIHASDDVAPWCWDFNAYDCAAAVDDLVLKMQREAHNDPNYTL